MSELEEALWMQICALGLPEPEREFRFHNTRRWRFDFAWPDKKIAIEVQGGLWRGGSHVTSRGVSRDIEKHNHAVELGWTILYATRETITSGEALRLIERVFYNTN